MSNITVNKNEKVCAVCGKSVKSDYCVTDDDYKICYKCCEKVGLSFKNMYLDNTLNDIVSSKFKPNAVVKHSVSKDNNVQPLFYPTKKIGKLLVDDYRKKWAINYGVFKGKSKLYSFTDIVSFELIEDGSSIVKGGLGSAVAGGLLFGGAGAITGGILGKKSNACCSTLAIKITVNSMQQPTEFIKIIDSEVKKNSSFYKLSYKEAQECMSLLQLVYNKGIDEANKNKVSKTPAIEANRVEKAPIDVPAEILRYKELLDCGAISLEEYNKKKDQLLNL